MRGDTWVVPGAPLEGGAGWRLWCSRPGEGWSEPAVSVSRLGREERVATEWALVPFNPVIGRQMAVLTVRMLDPEPGAVYEVSLPGITTPMSWRTLPATDAGSATFMIGSCFWRNADKEGHYGAAMTDLKRLADPHFTVLMGDQLYQDWPPQLDQWSDPLELFARRYAEYWGDPGYQQVLQAAPNFIACDDHEFWNNYPEPQIQVPFTIPSESRRRALEAAKETYRHYQHAANPDGQRHFSFTAAGVSFYLADTRSERTPHDDRERHFFVDEQRAALSEWVGTLAGPAVLVLPQPLYQKPGDFKDYALANFEADYAELCGLFERALGGQTGDGRPHDILVLTGDIHTGRHATGYINGSADPVHEFVASPASLVGPAQQHHTASAAPGKISPQHGAGWEVRVTDAPGSPTIDNNVGVVRVTPGRNGRVRFGLELWRVRPHDDRPFWKRLVGVKERQAPLTRLFAKEIELR